MNRWIKIITLLIVLIIGLTACSESPDGAQDLLLSEQIDVSAGQTSQTIPPQLDLVSAANQLGITEEELISALGSPGQGPPNFAAVATKLDIPQQELMDALGAPTGAPANGAQAVPPGQPSGQQPLLLTLSTISQPTLTLMIVIIFFMQGGLILFSTLVIKSYKGVREAALATFSMAFGFLVIRLGNEFQIDQITSGFLSNLLIISGFVLFYLAVCRFSDKACNRWVLYGFVPLAYLVLTVAWLFRIHALPLLYVSATATLVLNLSSAFTLYRSNTRRYRLAAYLTALPLSIYGLISISRMIISFFDRATITPGLPSFSANFDIMSLFVASHLWSSGFILMISQRLQSNLNDLAMNDALTRIRNRRAMQDMLDFEMRRVEKEVRDFSIILIDIDYFKHVNDTHGHDIDDQVLQWFASTLQNSMRMQDVVARWGGEEFLILLPDTLLEEARQIAERLRSTISSFVIDIPSGTLQITFSAGVSSSTESRSVDKLYKVADQALYIAKQTRNQVVSQEDIPAEPV
ncbi:MAG: GGDEF domain-containing protein [Anaerolineae bacterium]|jgi:diguanylate cyclase (GGDEF)-like protein|nr:GGDEF domain-containing protein [Anaerolineae bacterium]MBT7190342.1 GGDEF domain-containing protein [Anaerolineae bacterium]MBT7991747.1 GGDEF domain-containing protein [Anaerolineae bacterium]